MNKRVDSSIRSSVEPKPRLTSELDTISTRRAGGLISDSVFFAHLQYRTQIENIARVDVSQSVARLIKRLISCMSDAESGNGANHNNLRLEASIANEFRHLADHMYYAMRALVQEGAVRFNQKLSKLDLSIGTIDRKIAEYRTQAPALLHTDFLQAEFNLRQASINDKAVRRKFERFRYLHRLQHRDPRKVTAFSVFMAGTFAVFSVGFYTAFNISMLADVFINNQLAGLVTALAFAATNFFFGGILVGWFGVRYLIHDKLAKKLFPGVFSILLGLLGIFAIALYLNLMVVETKRLTMDRSDVSISTHALAIEHETKLKTLLKNTNANVLGLPSDEASSNKSLSVILATLLSAVFAYSGALLVSDIYPGYTAAGRALQAAQNEQGSTVTEGEKMITDTERHIVADLRKSLRETKPLVVGVESEVLSVQVLIGEMTYVTGVLNEGYHESLSRYHHDSIGQYTAKAKESVKKIRPIVLPEDGTPSMHKTKRNGSYSDRAGAAAGEHRFASDQLTSALTALRADSEENLRKLNVMSSKKLAKADAQLQRQLMVTEDLEELVKAIRQRAAEYKLRLTQEQSEDEQRKTTAASVARTAPAALELESVSEESRIILNG